MSKQESSPDHEVVAQYPPPGEQGVAVVSRPVSVAQGAGGASDQGDAEPVAQYPPPGEQAASVRQGDTP